MANIPVLKYGIAPRPTTYTPSAGGGAQVSGSAPTASVVHASTGGGAQVGGAATLAFSTPPTPASSTAAATTSATGQLGTSVVEGSTASCSSSAAYTYAKGAFATSSATIAGQAVAVAKFLLQVNSIMQAIGAASELGDDLFLGNSVMQAQSTATASMSISVAAGSTMTVTALARGSQVYYEIGLSDASVAGAAAAVRSLSGEVKSALLVHGAAAGAASYHVLAESLAEILSGIQFLNDYMSGWAYNMNTGAPSFYEKFRFNSFAKLGQDYYGMADDGLHLLGADDDSGEDIDAVITTGSSDMGDPRTKKVQLVYAGARSDKPMTLTCRVDENPEFSYEFLASPEQVAPTRVKVGKGLEGRYWQFEIRNQDGADFEIDALDIPVIPNSRRV